MLYLLSFKLSFIWMISTHLSEKPPRMVPCFIISIILSSSGLATSPVSNRNRFGFLTFALRLFCTSFPQDFLVAARRFLPFLTFSPPRIVYFMYWQNPQNCSKTQDAYCFPVSHKMLCPHIVHIICCHNYILQNFLLTFARFYYIVSTSPIAEPHSARYTTSQGD